MIDSFFFIMEINSNISNLLCIYMYTYIIILYKCICISPAKISIFCHLYIKLIAVQLSIIKQIPVLIFEWVLFSTMAYISRLIVGHCWKQSLDRHIADVTINCTTAKVNKKQNKQNKQTTSMKKLPLDKIVIGTLNDLCPRRNHKIFHFLFHIITKRLHIFNYPLSHHQILS